MALYFNMEKSLLRNGGRKAPTISEGVLWGLVEVALERFKEDDFEEDPRMNSDMDGLDMLFYDAMTNYPGVAPFQKVEEDLGKVDVDWENIFLEEMVVGSNGIPAIRGILFGDWETPVVFFLYWDGKTFRAYIPTYGNSFNRYCKSAFGSEDSDRGKIYRKYHIVCGPAPADKHWEGADCDNWHGRHKDGNDLFYESAGTEIHLEEGEEFDVELTEENYDFFIFGNVCPDLDACLEDFSSRVVSTGEATVEETRKWGKTLWKLAVKSVTGRHSGDDAGEAYGREEKDNDPDDEESGPVKPIYVPAYKLLVSMQDGGIVIGGDDMLELRWENGEVVFIDSDLNNPVSDSVLETEIDGLELTGPHRGHYTAKQIEPRLVRNGLADNPGLPELFELLRLYGKRLKLAVEYETFLQLMNE